MSAQRPLPAYPDAIDPAKVGQYPALCKSGGGFFYDEVLEYRVWVHPEMDDTPEPNEGDDYYFPFATYSEALAFSRVTPGAEEPLVLVLQRKCINEATPGTFLASTTQRITEWRVEWLASSRRKRWSIWWFLFKHRYLARRGA